MANRSRTERVNVWLLPEEADMLLKNSMELNLSKSDYIRKLILYGAVVGQHPVIDQEQGKKLLYEINKIGVNINQIAYQSNKKNSVSDSDWQKLHRMYLELLASVGKLLGLEEDEWNNWRQEMYNFMHTSIGKDIPPLNDAGGEQDGNYTYPSDYTDDSSSY